MARPHQGDGNRHGLVAVGVLFLLPPLQLVFAVAHDDQRRLALGGDEGLGGAITVTTLRHHGGDFGQAREDACHRTLCDVLRPVAMHGTDDLELRELLDAFMDAG